MSEVDDDGVVVQIDSNDDDDEKTDEISHLYGEDENGGGGEEIISSPPPAGLGFRFRCFHLLQFRKLALESLDLAFPLASGAGVFNLLCNRFEAVRIAVKAVVRGDGQKHLESLHIVPQSELLFQILKKCLVFREDDNRVLLGFRATRDCISGHFVFVAGGLVIFVGVHLVGSRFVRGDGERMAEWPGYVKLSTKDFSDFFHE